MSLCVGCTLNGNYSVRWLSRGKQWLPAGPHLHHIGQSIRRLFGAWRPLACVVYLASGCSLLLYSLASVSHIVSSLASVSLLGATVVIVLIRVVGAFSISLVLVLLCSIFVLGRLSCGSLLCLLISSPLRVLADLLFFFIANYRISTIALNLLWLGPLLFYERMVRHVLVLVLVFRVTNAISRPNPQHCC